MRTLLAGILLAASAALLPAAKNLEVYSIDVEGGQATLIVSPSGESMLVDTGWGGHNKRDAERIAAAAKAAGVKKIDYLVITHYHTDHVGGVGQLAEKLPIRNFVDHGAERGKRQGGAGAVQRVRGVSREGDAHRGEAGRHDSDQGARRQGALGGGQGDRRAAARARGSRIRSAPDSRRTTRTRRRMRNRWGC